MAVRGAHAEALAMRGDRIIAGGSLTEVSQAAGQGARTVSIGGRALLPGFIDAHHHFLQAVVYGGAVDLGITVVTQPDFVRLPALELLPPPGGFRY